MSELKFCPLCGGNMKLEKIIGTYGMDGSYSNWKLSCTKCGITKEYAADGFYGREYITKEEVIDDWNELSETEIKSMTKEQNYMCGYRDGKSDVLDKIRAEIEQLPTTKCTETHRIYIDAADFKENVLAILDKYKAESAESEE